MKTIKKLFASLLTVGMLFTSLPVCAYEYTVTVSTAGKTVDGQSGTITVGTVGDALGYEGKETDDGYYVKAVYYAGTETKATASDSLKEDTELVLSYGMKQDDSKKCTYTVNYVDQNGNTLATSYTGTGYIGDTPVIPYLPISGYIPQAYNLTTNGLTGDASHDTFTFRYTPDTTVTVTPGTTTTTETTTTTTTTTGGDQGTTTAGGDQGTTTGGDQGTTTGGEEETNEPADLINIDDEDQPLANLDDGESSTTSQSTFPTAYVVAGAGLLVLLLALFAFLRSKKQEEE